MGFISHSHLRRITSVAYILAVLLSAFGAFHAHRLAVAPIAPTHEVHDSSCDFHAKPPVHLSDHCAACQFLIASGPVHFHAASDVTGYRLSSSFTQIPVHSTHDSDSHLRGPPDLS